MLPRRWRPRMARMLSAPRETVFLPEDSPLGEEPNRSLREDAALSLMDPDTHGYLLLTMKRTSNGQGRITLSASQLSPRWLPAFKRALRKIADAA